MFCNASRDSFLGGSVETDPILQAQTGETPAMATYDTVHVGGLPPGTSEQSVREIFGQYAPIHASKVLETGPGQAVEALVGIGKEASKWLVETLDSVK